MTYYHWSANPVKLRKMSYPQSGHPKPNGLWFDVNEDWKRWCEATDFRPETFRYRHTVTLLDASRIIFLKTARDIDAFTRKYARDLSVHIEPLQGEDDTRAFPHRYGLDLFGEIRKQFSQYIMWGEVSEKHTGIIISPYLHTRSETYLWYYGWRCASGCVWDTGVIRLGKPCRMVE